MTGELLGRYRRRIPGWAATILAATVGLVSGGGCAGPDGALRSAIDVLRIDDLCETECATVSVDSLVRRTYDRRRMASDTSTVEARLVEEDLTPLRGNKRLVLGSYLDGMDSGWSSMRFAYYSDSVATREERRYLLSFFSPRAGARGWEIVVRRNGIGWVADQPRLIFAP